MASKNKTAETVDVTETAMVALDEQLTETEERALVAVPESSGDAAVAEKPAGGLLIDQTAPWAQWADPDVLCTPLHSLAVRGHETQGLSLLGEEGDELGGFSPRAMQQLGWTAHFPGEFLAKLPPHLAASVINDRIQAEEDREIQVVFEGGRCVNLAPGWRGVASYKDVAQTAHNVLRDVYGDSVTLGEARQADGQMVLRLLTGVSEVVTPAVGDILRMGIQIEHNYGLGLQLSLYVDRLVCLNGMTAGVQEFTWRNRSTGSSEHQLAWLAAGIGGVMDSYERIVQRARLMADTLVKGDPKKALEEYALAMKFPRRMLGRLMDAYDQEPVPTQWGLLNALTRVSTHSLTGSAQRTFQQVAGSWTQEFDLVTARLPRPVADRVGAEVIEAV